METNDINRKKESRKKLKLKDIIIIGAIIMCVLGAFIAFRTSMYDRNMEKWEKWGHVPNSVSN